MGPKHASGYVGAAWPKWIVHRTTNPGASSLVVFSYVGRAVSSVMLSGADL